MWFPFFKQMFISQTCENQEKYLNIQNSSFRYIIGHFRKTFSGSDKGPGNFPISVREAESPRSDSELPGLEVCCIRLSWLAG